MKRRRLRGPGSVGIAALVASFFGVMLAARPVHAGDHWWAPSTITNYAPMTVVVMHDWNYNADAPNPCVGQRRSCVAFNEPRNPGAEHFARLLPGFSTFNPFELANNDWDAFFLPPSCSVTYRTLAGSFFLTSTSPSGAWVRVEPFEMLAISGICDSAFLGGWLDTVPSIDNAPQPGSDLSAMSAPAPAGGIGVKRNDYTRDGVSDIVAVRDDCLHRWTGTGTGGFNYIGTYGCGWNPYAASLTSVGDINRDGIGDLVAVRDDCLHRWYGTGNSGYQYAGTYGCGWGRYASTLRGVGDINGDGVGDLVAVYNDVLYRWVGNGNGGFNFFGTWGNGWGQFQASLTGAGDINRDGIGDLVAVANDCLHRWYGTPNGGFTYAGTYGCGWGPYAATLTGMGDINRDGVGDLLSTAGDCLHRWYGTGTGGFTYAGTYGCGWSAYPIR